MQELLKRDTRAEKAMTEPKLYAGLVFCGDCGRGMVSRKVKYKNTVNEYYICSGYNRGRECTRHSIKVDVLNEIVLGELKKYVKQLTDTKKLLAILDEKQIHFEEALNRDKEIARLREKEQEYSAMKTSLYTDLREVTVKSIYENGIAAGRWLDEFRENMEIEELDRMLLISLIDKILVYEGKIVEIVFKYRNEMAKAVDLIKGELETAPLKEVS